VRARRAQANPASTAQFHLMVAFAPVAAFVRAAFVWLASVSPTTLSRKPHFYRGALPAAGLFIFAYKMSGLRHG